MNQKMWDELKRQVGLKEMSADQAHREQEKFAYMKIQDLIHNMEVDYKNGAFKD